MLSKISALIFLSIGVSAWASNTEVKNIYSKYSGLYRIDSCVASVHDQPNFCKQIGSQAYISKVAVETNAGAIILTREETWPTKCNDGYPSILSGERVKYGITSTTAGSDGRPELVMTTKVCLEYTQSTKLIKLSAESYEFTREDVYLQDNTFNSSSLIKLVLTKIK